MPQQNRWIYAKYEYEWHEETSRRFIFFGEEETRWNLRDKSGSWGVTPNCTPAESRLILKLHKTKPCKIKSGAMYEVTKGAADLDRPLTLYWYRDGFYCVSVEVKDDEIAGFIEDYEEQENEKVRARESRKEKELASVRDRIRGKSKPKAKTKTDFLPPPKEGWTVDAYAEARGISDDAAWRELRAASAEGKVIEHRRSGVTHYAAAD